MKKFSTKEGNQLNTTESNAATIKDAFILACVIGIPLGLFMPWLTKKE